MKKKVIIIVCTVVLAVGVFFAGRLSVRAQAQEKPAENYNIGGEPAENLTAEENTAEAPPKEEELTEYMCGIISEIRENAIVVEGVEDNWVQFREGKFLLDLRENAGFDDSYEVGQKVWFYFLHTHEDVIDIGPVIDLSDPNAEPDPHYLGEIVLIYNLK